MVNAAKRSGTPLQRAQLRYKHSVRKAGPLEEGPPVILCLDCQCNPSRTTA